MSIENFVSAAKEALSFAVKYDRAVEKLPEIIALGKEKIENIEKKRQEMLEKNQRLGVEYVTLMADFNKYGREKQLIERSKNLEEEINNKDRQNGHLKAKVERLKHRLRIETDASMKLDSLNGEYLQGLSHCQKELEECEKKLERRQDI